MTRPIPLDMLEWQIGRAIALVAHEHPAPAPIGKIAAREVLQAIEAAGWRVVEKNTASPKIPILGSQEAERAERHSSAGQDG